LAAKKGDPSVPGSVGHPFSAFPAARRRFFRRNEPAKLAAMCVCVKNGEKEDESKGERRKPIKAKRANGYIFAGGPRRSCAFLWPLFPLGENSVAISLRDLTFSEISPLPAPPPRSSSVLLALAHSSCPLAFEFFFLTLFFFAHLRFACVLQAVLLF